VTHPKRFERIGGIFFCEYCLCFHVICYVNIYIFELSIYFLPFCVCVCLCVGDAVGVERESVVSQVYYSFIKATVYSYISFHLSGHYQSLKVHVQINEDVGSHDSKTLSIEGIIKWTPRYLLKSNIVIMFIYLIQTTHYIKTSRENTSPHVT